MWNGGGAHFTPHPGPCFAHLASLAGRAARGLATLYTLHTLSHTHMVHTIPHTQVPISYIWSPSLVERPTDWPHYCEVVGFVNVELQKLTKYEPPKELKDFLAAGEGKRRSC